MSGQNDDQKLIDKSNAEDVVCTGFWLPKPAQDNKEVVDD